MLRITRMMEHLLAPRRPIRPAAPPAAPVVIWNLIRRCNLCCEHCYSISANRDFPGELSTREACAVLEDLARYGVPALILSGGEPLLRGDVLDLATEAKRLGIPYVGLSTNGTLIDARMADGIARTGFDYVGISIDGCRQTHDRVRRQAGAYDQAMAGLRFVRDQGVKAGLRFTLTQHNAADLEHVLGLLDTERIDRFYLSHLNYGGRGNTNRRHDAWHSTTRDAMTRIFDACWAGIASGSPREFTSGNNDADGVWLLQWARARMPGKTSALEAALLRWGGNATGTAISNIDNLGRVHPDTYWWDHSLGNVRDTPFSVLWRETQDPVMLGLRQRPRPVKGRCAACRYLPVCGGNTRVRALQVTGNPWQEDPGCYLTDEEIGVAPESPPAPAAATLQPPAEAVHA